MKLPFSRADFFDVFGSYNAALWPVALALWLASLAALVVLLRGHESSRGIAGLLALHWAWAGIAYHAWFFARINPAAYLFAARFLVEAVLLLRAGVIHERLRVRWTHSPRCCSRPSRRCPGGS